MISSGLNSSKTLAFDFPLILAENILDLDSLESLFVIMEKFSDTSSLIVRQRCMTESFWNMKSNSAEIDD